MNTAAKAHLAGPVLTALKGFLQPNVTCVLRHFGGYNRARCRRLHSLSLHTYPCRERTCFSVFHAIELGEHFHTSASNKLHVGISRCNLPPCHLEDVTALQWNSLSGDDIFSPSLKLQGFDVVSLPSGGFKVLSCPVSGAEGLGRGCPLSFRGPCLWLPGEMPYSSAVSVPCFPASLISYSSLSI